MEDKLGLDKVKTQVRRKFKKHILSTYTNSVSVKTQW